MESYAQTVSRRRKQHVMKWTTYVIGIVNRKAPNLLYENCNASLVTLTTLPRSFKEWPDSFKTTDTQQQLRRF